MNTSKGFSLHIPRKHREHGRKDFQGETIPCGCAEKEEEGKIYCKSCGALYDASGEGPMGFAYGVFRCYDCKCNGFGWVPTTMVAIP